MEPSIAIRTPPGLRNKPGWPTLLIAFVTKWYSFLIAILGRVAWFFNSAGGLVFFEHWPSFFLTFAIYRAGMAAFEGIAPEYHIELRDRPTMVWDFHSLLLAIQMMFSFMLVDETATLKLCPNCYKAFFTENEDDVYCSGECAIKE